MGEKQRKTLDWKLGFIIVSWFFLFSLTVQVGLSTRFFRLFLSADIEPLAGAILNIGLLILLMRFYRKWTKQLFEIKAKYIYGLYAILVIAVATIPLHYHMKLPVFVYMVFIPISVLWQNYITFGLLQKYLRTYVSKVLTIVIIAICFVIAHIILIPNFATTPALIILTIILAVLFTYIREKTGTLHWLIFIHLLFYAMFV